MRWWWGAGPFFEPSRPRKARGGIRSRSRRGAFAERWWARRWIAVLESFNMGARLGRGRAYARQGQVIAIDVQRGVVTAKVQGSRLQPYDVTIQVKTISPGGWKKLAAALRREALFAAKLVAGEMPEQIEEVFQRAGLSLFPGTRKDLRTDCSCPDSANPCKHIAAVYFLVGEEFDRDPFLMFRLRGVTREDLLRMVGQEAGSGTPAAADAAQAGLPEPLPADPVTFWGGEGAPQEIAGEVYIPAVAAAIARRLGPFPFWRGEENLPETLEQVYATASPAGLRIVLGERNRGKEMD